MGLIGSTTEVRLRAYSPDAAEGAHRPPDEDFPVVVAGSMNARLLSLMEMAAAKLMQPQLRLDQACVAVESRLNYLAADLQGELRAVAMYLGAAGRLHHFRVQVFDETGLIARGEHTRAVVMPRRLLAAARRRAGRPAMLLNV